MEKKKSRLASAGFLFKMEGEKIVDIIEFGVPLPSKPYEPLEFEIKDRKKKISLLEMLVDINERFSGFIWFKDKEKGKKIVLQCVNGYLYDVKEDGKSLAKPECGGRIYAALRYSIFGYVQKNNKYEGTPNLMPGLSLAHVINKLKEALKIDNLINLKV